MPESLKSITTVAEGELDTFRDSGSEIQDPPHIDQLSLEAEQDILDLQGAFTHGLPVEILSRVFVLYVDSHDCTGDVAFDTSPVCLSHVCRRWRDVALGIPILWRRVHLHSRHIVDDWYTSRHQV